MCKISDGQKNKKEEISRIKRERTTGRKGDSRERRKERWVERVMIR